MWRRILMKNKLDKDGSVHEIGRNNLLFGISFVNGSFSQVLSDESYTTYTVKQVSQQYITDSNGDTDRVRTKTDMEMKVCEGDFSQVDQDTVERIGADQIMWPTHKNYTVAGNFYSPRYDYIEIKFYKWDNSTSSVTCQTPDDINTMLSEAQIQVTIQNAYFDIENYDNPVQYFLDDNYFWDLLPNFRKKSDLFVREGHSEIQDNFIQFFNEKELDYYAIVDSKEQLVLEDSDGEFMSIFIRLDSTAEKYDRQVYSFSDLLAQVGGIYQSFFFIGTLFVGIFSERLFFSSILKKIYQLDKIREDQISYSRSQGINPHTEHNDQEIVPGDTQTVHLSKVLEDGVCDPIEAEQTKRSMLKTVTLVDNENKENDVNKDRKRRIFETIRFVIFNRQKFNYNWYDICEYILCCIRCRRNKSIRKIPKYRKHAYYNVGEEKLLNELDVISVIKAIRSLEAINKVLFTREQRLLLKFQSKDIIASSSDDSDIGASAARNIVYDLQNEDKDQRNLFRDRCDKLLHNYQKR